MNPSLAYVLGVLCGDASLLRKYIILETSSLEFANIFHQKLKNWTTITPSRYRDKKYFCVELCSILACNFVEKLGTFNTYNWIVPNVIKNGERNIKSVFLRGLFDSEGSVDFFKNTKRVTLRVVNKKGLKETQNLLSTLNIRSTLGKSSNTFCLRICGLKNLKMFRKRVGFLLSHKSKKLKKLVDSYKNPEHSPDEYFYIMELFRIGLDVKEISDFTNIPLQTIRSWKYKTRIPKSVRKIFKNCNKQVKVR